MARMIPSFIEGDLPPGEVSFYEGLARSSETKNWTVLFRQEMVNTRGREREIDFLVLVPGKGIAIVEVKSNSRVERRDGVWYFGSYTPDPIGPFRKTNDRKHQVMRIIADHDSRLTRSLPVCRLVVFTHATLRSDERSSVDWHPYEYCDGELYSRIGPREAVERALLPAAKEAKRAFGDEMIEQSTTEIVLTKIANLICPDFVGIESAGIRTRFREEELCRLTKAQSRALNGLRRAPRVVINGYAGSGKTSLAIQSAKELADAGKRVALFCFNNALGNHLKDVVASSDISFVGTAHKYALEVLRIERTDDDDYKDWDELITKATERLRTPTALKFDAIVVDEAQDYYLGNLQLVDLLDASLDGGLSNGTYRIFGDFMHQTLYGNANWKSADYLTLIEGEPITYELADNCRNTRQVATFAEAVGSLNPGYEQVLRTGEGGLQVRPFANQEEESEELIRVLANLKSRGFEAAEIVILTLGPVTNSTVSSVAANGSAPYPLKEFRGGAFGIGRHVMFTTIRKFKGLEAPIVIVSGLPLDKDMLEAAETRDLLYVAVTRSLHSTVLLTPKGGASIIANWLAPQVKEGTPHE